VVAAEVAAVDAASAKLVLLDLLVPMDLMEKMELPVKMAQMAKTEPLPLLKLNLNLASNVLNLQLVLPVTQDLKVHPVMLVLLVPLLMVVHVDPLAHLDLLDLPDNLVPMEMLVHPVPLVLSTMFPAQLDHPALPAQMDNPDLLDLPVPMDNLDSPEEKVHLEMLDPMELPETQEAMEKMAQMEKLVPVVLAITVLLPVLPQDIKPFNNHLWEADLLLKAWLPLGRVDKISVLFFPLFIIFGHRQLWRNQKNRLDLGSHASS